MSSRGTISFVVDKCYPFFNGGYERKIFIFARSLSETWKVKIFTSMPNEHKNIGAIEFQKIFGISFQRNANSRSYLHSFLFALSLIREPQLLSQSDVVLVESIPYVHLLVISLFWKKYSLPEHKKIIMVDEAWYRYNEGFKFIAKLRNIFIRKLFRIVDRNVDLYWAMSKVTANSLSENFGINPKKIRMIQPGHIRMDEVERLLRSFGDTSKIYDFSTVARLVKIKHIEDFISALSLLKENYGWKGRAAVVGSGPMADHLVQLTKELGLQENIKFFGNVSDASKFRILGSTRVFVLCSEREGLSHSTLEALACGLPAIVARPANPEVFGVSEIIQDSVNGYYFNLHDVDLMARKMNFMLSNPETINKFSQNSLRIAKRYDHEEILKRVMEMLTE